MSVVEAEPHQENMGTGLRLAATLGFTSGSAWGFILVFTWDFTRGQSPKFTRSSRSGRRALLEEISADMVAGPAHKGHRPPYGKIALARLPTTLAST